LLALEQTHSCSFILYSVALQNSKGSIQNEEEYCWSSAADLSQFNCKNYEVWKKTLKCKYQQKY